MKPGVSTYSEVQIVRVDDTLDNHAESLADENDLRKEALQEQADHDKETVINDNQPGLKEMGTAALTGAAIGAGISLATDIYKNYKDGKNVFAG